MRSSELIKSNNRPFLEELSPEEHEALNNNLARILGILALDHVTYPDADIQILIDQLGLSAEFPEQIEKETEDLRKQSRQQFAAYLRENAINFCKLLAIARGGQPITLPTYVIPIYGNTNPLETFRINSRYFIDKQSYPFIPNHPNIPFGRIKSYIDQLIELLKNWQNYKDAERKNTLTRIHQKDTTKKPSEELIQCEMQIASIRERVNTILYKYYIPKSQKMFALAAE